MALSQIIGWNGAKPAKNQSANTGCGASARAIEPGCGCGSSYRSVTPSTGCDASDKAQKVTCGCGS